MPNVSKRQKGFQLPENVIEWLEAAEVNTGATLSRLALAAFCAYMMATPHRRREFMQAAMMVERGAWSFTDITSRMLELSLDATKATLEFTTDEAGRKGLQAVVRRLERDLDKARGEQGRLPG